MLRNLFAELFLDIVKINTLRYVDTIKLKGVITSERFLSGL